MDELALTIDHVTLSVADLGAAQAFYSAALAPLGLDLIAELTEEQTGAEARAAFGIGRKGQLWLVEKGRTTPPTHLCFRAKDRAAVNAFYHAALIAGGTCNGAPGIRHHYHPEYYAAFVSDSEGHNIEALCFSAD